MTATRCGLRTVIIAGAMVLAAAAARAQTVAPPAHDHGNSREEAAAPVDNMAARLASLDERIAMLLVDMKMFTGELKIQAMADVLEALVERQTLLDAEMKRMHEHMSGPMNDRRRHAPPQGDLEPETMCSPFI